MPPCTHCGQELSAEAVRFCTACGARIEGEGPSINLQRKSPQAGPATATSEPIEPEGLFHAPPKEDVLGQENRTLPRRYIGAAVVALAIVAAVVVLSMTGSLLAGGVTAKAGRAVADGAASSQGGYLMMAYCNEGPRISSESFIPDEGAGREVARLNAQDTVIDGKCNAWTYHYRVPGQRAPYTVIVEGGARVLFQGVNTADWGMFQPQGRIGDWKIDSDEAMRLAKAADQRIAAANVSDVGLVTIGSNLIWSIDGTWIDANNGNVLMRGQ